MGPENPGVVSVRRKRVAKPLDPVPVTPLPERPYYYPFNSEEEYLDAIDIENKRLITEIENKELRDGKIPIGITWWKFVAGGLGAALIAILAKGC